MEQHDDWAERCLRAALADAGFSFTERRGGRGTLIAGLNYGPSPDSQVHLTAQVELGALLLVADELVDFGEPTPAQLNALNDVTIDWAVGRMGWASHRGKLEARVALFAYPDFVPPGPLVQWVCHHLWEEQEALKALRCPQPSFPPLPIEDVAARFEAAGIRLRRHSDGSFVTRVDTGDTGSFGLRIGETVPGVAEIDALPLRARPFEGDMATHCKLADLNGRLSTNAATTWGAQVVVRHSTPTVWIPDHPQWAKFVLDAASWACMDVVRILEGGPVDRPAAN